MAGPVTVSVSIGAFRPLIDKLSTLLGDEYKKLKGVRQQASFVRDELKAMETYLKHLELMDELNVWEKSWRDHIREMSYDMENCIDDLMRISGGDAKEGRFKKIGRRLKMLREHHRIADQMEILKNLAIEANAQRLRYNIRNSMSSTNFVNIDPRVHSLYVEANNNLVGINGPTEQLVTWLTGDDKKIKVVSIVGFGGLGKTTLAKQVYDKIGGQFGCKAFISVSQKPDMASLLNELQLRLGIQESSRSVADIIDRLREFLTHQRFLIVVDDLWDAAAWNIISCALPESGNGSRVIVTTRVESVASSACHSYHEGIYRMKPLKEQDSRKLFYNRVFGSEDGCPPQIKEISYEILKRCGGLPLAIITIASLLASSQASSRNDWERIMNSLGTQFGTNPTLKGMNSILNLSYTHLPLHLRACFLYLCMYPEDHEINRDDLIRQWVTEGFVSSLPGLDLYDVAKSYFNELINRSLIQPGKTEYGETLSCRVHDMLLDLIIRKCAEDNFVSVAHSSEDMAKLHHNMYNIHRLSLSSIAGGAVGTTAIVARQPKVRSLALFKRSKYMPPLLLFKYLRVLTLEDTANELLTIDLTAISQLFLLRYLKVSVQRGIKLPAKLQGLFHLEILDIGCKWMNSIPSDIILLPHLSCLILPKFTGLSRGVGNMKSLRTLHSFFLEECTLKDIMGLGQLTDLRELSLMKLPGSELETSKVDALASTIEKLHQLRCLNIYGSGVDDNNLLGSLLCPFPGIEQLTMTYWEFPRVPKWIGDLHCLCFLSLRATDTSTEDLHLLGELPSLIHLDFQPFQIPKQRAIIGIGLFPVLEHLQFWSDEDVTAYLGFEAGAMPKLHTLHLSALQWHGTIPVGMEHLLSLQKIEVFGTPDVVSAFMSASLVHPNRPAVTKF